MIKKLSRKIKNACWQRNRKKVTAAMRDRLRTNDVTIISANCNGGIVSHDLGLQFRSPTVNLFIPAEDFIKFCENLPYYLSIDTMVECVDPAVTKGVSYPVAYLGDILLFLVHYSSVEEAQRIWNQRKQRINWNNIAVMATDRDGMTDKLKDRFERLPYRKVMFTHLPDEKHPSCFYISGYEKDDCVGIVTDHNNWKGTRPIDQFDYVGFLNENEAPRTSE